MPHRAGVAELSLIAGLDTSNITRRTDAARLKLQTDRKLAYAKAQTEKIYIAGQTPFFPTRDTVLPFYTANIAESQT